MVFLLVRRRRISSRLSPFIATLLLTGAAFLLPAVGDGRPASASADRIRFVSALTMPLVASGFVRMRTEPSRRVAWRGRLSHIE